MASRQLKVSHPLAEVFGFKVDKFSNDAVKSRNEKLCPYNNVIEKCTKDKSKNPLGVCSIYHKNAPTIICPVRFREDWKICEDAAEFFFKKGAMWSPIKEVRLKDDDGKAAGNIDLVLVNHDKMGKIFDFGAIEVQAVYISGNIRRPFENYIKNPEKNYQMDWTEEDNYPNPDFLSSSRKRLAPQLAYKGQILSAWGKKQVVVIDKPFFASLPTLEQCSRASSDLCWQVYKMDDSQKGRGYTISLDQRVYTGFEPTMKKLGTPEIGDIEPFVKGLEKKLAIVIQDLQKNHGVSSISELLAKSRSAKVSKKSILRDLDF